jgi:hypothetical protein
MYMFRRKIWIVGIALQLITNQAWAMGSGNPYQDAQTGLDYIVYQPTNTLKLPLKNFSMDSCNNGHDEVINALYGSGKKFFTIRESSTKWICPINYMLIRGAVRTVKNYPGADMLTGTSVSTISFGLKSSEIATIFKYLVPKYRARGK